MEIHRHFTNNSLRNFNYLLACTQSKKAIAIDPLDHQAIISIIKKHHYELVGIVNTHDHGDHTGGNIALLDFKMAPVYAHHTSTHIPGFSSPIKANQKIYFGGQTIEVWETPGHTEAHVCLYYPGSPTQPPAFFSGDTLFNAGVGNCYSGDVHSLFDSITMIKNTLRDETIIYPGHDYLENNCRFTISCEPDNALANNIIADIVSGKIIPQNAIHSLGAEKKINSFFRLNNLNIKTALMRKKLLTPSTKSSETEKRVFIALRQLRDQW